jgi:hypothetical protein
MKDVQRRAQINYSITRLHHRRQWPPRTRADDGTSFTIIITIAKKQGFVIPWCLQSRGKTNAAKETQVHFRQTLGLTEPSAKVIVA